MHFVAKKLLVLSNLDRGGSIDPLWSEDVKNAWGLKILQGV